MILSNYDSFIYTHIPKCGGTSFREYIYRTALKNGISEKKIHVPGFGGLSNGKNIEQLTEDELKEFRSKEKIILACHARYNVHAKYYLNMYNPFYYIIYREPVKRFISHYNFFYRDLGYNGLKGIELDDLSEGVLNSLLEKLANIQMVYTINLKKPIGKKADETWLAEAKRTLSEWYGAFGVLENMEASIAILKNTGPEWLSFPDMEFPVKNKGQSESKSQISRRVLEEIRLHNQYDLKLYEHAEESLESQNIYKKTTANG